MNLLKTSLYTSVSTAISFISGFIVTKVVAVKIGPEGMALTGQFQNTTSILIMLSTAAITSGVVKYLAEYSGRIEDQQKVIKTGISIILISSVVISSVVMISSRYLSSIIFHTVDFWLVYLLYGLFIVLISLNIFFTSVYNGLKQIRKLTIINITSSVTGIIFTVLAAQNFGVKGVLIASNFTALFVFLVNLYFIRSLNFSFKPAFKKWDKKLIKLLSVFTLMTIVSGFVSPFMQILVRDKIIINYSVNDAGLWQAVSKISDYYLGFITTVLIVYYLPRYAEIKSNEELKKEILKGYKVILPAVALLAFSIWLFRGLIVTILFTPKFAAMLPLFKFQLLGDFFKIGSWLIGFIMVSKAMIKSFIITELIFSATYVLWCYFFINKYGVVGATYGFCLNYLIYWFAIAIIMYKYCTSKKLNN